jgi:Holliday junction resolvasome RuvABC endonuclease subunit
MTWEVLSQLVSPNDITVNSYKPNRVKKAVLGISDGLIFI